jgi:hypothetical protein
MLEASMKMKLFFTYRPWEDEPDRAEWVHENGLKCRINRNPITGTLCGYVGVPKGHQHFKGHYDDEVMCVADLDIHGGLTYSEMGDDGYWYFGFDTAHSDDFSPKIVEHLIEAGRKDFAFYQSCDYKTWEYVNREIEFLAEWLARE